MFFLMIWKSKHSFLPEFSSLDRVTQNTSARLRVNKQYIAYLFKLNIPASAYHKATLVN